MVKNCLQRMDFDALEKKITKSRDLFVLNANEDMEMSTAMTSISFIGHFPATCVLRSVSPFDARVMESPLFLFFGGGGAPFSRASPLPS